MWLGDDVGWLFILPGVRGSTPAVSCATPCPPLLQHTIRTTQLCVPKLRLNNGHEAKRAKVPSKIFLTKGIGGMLALLILS